MKKTIRLTESDLIRLVKRVIKESSLNMAEMNKYKGLTANEVMDCAKNNFDLNITIPFPDDTADLGNACKRMVKTKTDKDTTECVFALSQGATILADTYLNGKFYPKKVIINLINCLKDKLMKKQTMF